MDDTKATMIAPAFTKEAHAVPVRGDYAAQPPFDAGKYWSYLEGLDATDAEKTALLEALWGLMAQFVALGFGVDPVQTLIPALVSASIAESAGNGSDGAASAGFNQATHEGGAGP